MHVQEFLGLRPVQDYKYEFSVELESDLFFLSFFFFFTNKNNLFRSCLDADYNCTLLCTA